MVVGFGVGAVTVMVVGARVVGRLLVTVVGFEVGAATVMAVGAREVVGTLVVVTTSLSNIHKSGNVKYPASWASAMQKSRLTLVVVVPLFMQYLPTTSHMLGRAAKPNVANVSNWLHASSMLWHKHPLRINSPSRHDRRAHMPPFGSTP